MNKSVSRRELLNELIQDLKGTAQCADSVAWEMGLGELTIEDWLYIETEIFQCTGCGWWCELCEGHYSELDNEYLCDDCCG